MKLVGYTAVVSALRDRLADGRFCRTVRRTRQGSSLPGLNDGLDSQWRCLRHGALAGLQLAPRRVNAIHPGIVGDSPYWSGKPQATAKTRDATPTGRNVTMADIVDGVDFLMRNRSVNGIDFYVDGGWLRSELQ